jgi:hypothetical protein
MKTGKFIIAASASVLLLTAGNSQASINWDTFPYSQQAEYSAYTFDVQANGGNFIETKYYYNTNSESSGYASSYGGIVNRSLTDPISTKLVMNAGAQGTGSTVSPPDGLSIQAYAEMIFTGYDDTIYAVMGSQQQVVANATRRLTVDSPGTYNFSADFLGDINYPGLDFEGLTISATLSGFIYNGSGTELTSLSDTSLSFDMFGNANQDADVQLKAFDASGKPIFYQIGLSIYLNTAFSNFDLLFGTATDISFLDAGNGHLYAGTVTDPLTLSCSLTPAETQVPVPPAALLLFSGLSGLAIFRRKARG